MRRPRISSSRVSIRPTTWRSLRVDRVDQGPQPALPVAVAEVAGVVDAGGGAGVVEQVVGHQRDHPARPPARRRHGVQAPDPVGPRYRSAIGCTGGVWHLCVRQCVSDRDANANDRPEYRPAACDLGICVALAITAG